MTARVRFASGLTDDTRLVARLTKAIELEVNCAWRVRTVDENCEAAAIRVLGIVERQLARAKRARAKKGK